MTDTALLFRRPGEKAIRALPPDIPFPRTNPYDMVIDSQGNLWGCGEWSGGGLARRDGQGRWRGWSKTPAGEPLTAVHHAGAQPARRRLRCRQEARFYYCDGETLTPLDSLPLPAGGERQHHRRSWRTAAAASGRATTPAWRSWKRTARWRLLNDRPGFNNHHVFCIGEDWKGTVWVNTARGVFRFLADYQVEEFNPDDGLADWETNANGFFSDARGDIWIGTVNGLSQYNPGRPQRQHRAAAAGGRERPPAQALARLPPRAGPGLERTDTDLRHRRALLPQPQPHRLPRAPGRPGKRLAALAPPGGAALHQPAGRRPEAAAAAGQRIGRLGRDRHPAHPRPPPFLDDARGSAWAGSSSSWPPPSASTAGAPCCCGAATASSKAKWRSAPPSWSTWPPTTRSPPCSTAAPSWPCWRGNSSRKGAATASWAASWST